MPLYIKNLSLAWGDALPFGGGLYDQPAQLMHRIEHCMGIYLAVRKQVSFNHSTVEGMSDAERAIIAALQEAGIMDAVWAYRKNKEKDKRKEV